MEGDEQMRVLCICMAMVCLLGFSSAWAEEEKTSRKPIDMRYTIYGGAQFYKMSGEFGYIKDGQPDIEVDEDDLGLDDTSISPIVGAIINFWDNRLTPRLDYFGYHEDATEVNEFRFEFDDIVFDVGTILKSDVDLDLYVANLSYNFIRTERARFGVGLGVHAADMDIQIRGTAVVGGIDVPIGTGEADLLAPVPNIYVMGAYAFTDKFLFKGGGGGLSMSYGDYDGHLYFINAFLEYWPWRHVGFGGGFRYFDADIEYDPGHKKETYKFSLPGPVAYITAGF